MVWFKVDDSFWSHPKTAGLSDSATALWVRAGTWSAQHLTDGRVPQSALRLFRGHRRAVDALVDARLWEEAEGGYQFVNWDEWQPSRDSVEEKRRLTRERVANHRRRTAGKSGEPVDNSASGTPEPVVSPSGAGAQPVVSPSRADSEPSRIPANTGNEAARNAVTTSAPTRPDPTNRDISNEISLSSEVAAAPPRPEIARLLDLLDSEIRRNGGRVPSRTRKNTDAARLMLDRDGLTVDQVERAIRWSQADEFWRSNVLSMSKLREKYDQLRLAAQRTGGSASGRLTPTQRAMQTAEAGRRFAAREVAGRVITSLDPAALPTAGTRDLPSSPALKGRGEVGEVKRDLTRSPGGGRGRSGELGEVGPSERSEPSAAFLTEEPW